MTSGREPRSTRSRQLITSQRMNPRAMSVWIVSAASSAVSPLRSVQARVSLSPAVKNVTRSSASWSFPAISSSADCPPSRNSAASSSGSCASSSSRSRSIPPGPLTTVTTGFVVSDRAARLDVGEQSLERDDLVPELRVTGLRLLAHALEPPLDVVAVGDEQLETELLDLILRSHHLEER